MKTIEELNADLDMAIEDGDTAAMEDISEQISALLEGKPPAIENPENDVEDPDNPGDSSASSGAEGDEGEGEDVDGDGDKDDSEEVDGILSKDGKRVFPYSVLQKDREQIAELKQQLEEMQKTQQVDPAVLAEVEKLRRLNSAYEQQIKAHDLEPAKLPEELKFTDEQLSQLQEFGDLGAFAAQLARKVSWMESQLSHNQQQIDQQPQQSSADIVKGDPDMSRWAQSDYAWNKLVAIDDYVKTLPQFAGKSLAERKDEVIRLTRIELGEASRETPPPPPAKKGKSADEIVAGTEAIPTSLSEMGGASARQEASFAEQTAGKSEIEIAMLMDQRLSRGESIDDLL